MSGFFPSKDQLKIALLAMSLSLLVNMAGADESALASNNQTGVAVTSSTPAFTGPLTIQKATERALIHDPRVTTLKATAEVAHQDRRAATDFKDPVVQGESRSLGRTGGTSGDELDDSRVSASLPLPNPWLMVPKVDGKNATWAAARADLQAAEWQVTCDIRQLFFELNYLTNDLSYCADLLRLNGEVLKTVQARAGQGAATAGDLMTATRQYLQFQNDFDQALRRYKLAQRQLASDLELPLESLQLRTDNLPDLSLSDAKITFPQAEAIALKNRADLAALHSRTAAANYAYREVRNVRYPWIKDAKAGYLDQPDKYWVGLSMDVPIFTWGKNHAADAARAKETLANVNEMAGLKSARQDLHDALDELDESRQQADRNRANVEPLIATMRQTVAALRSNTNAMPDQIAAAELQLAETLRFDLETRWRYESAILNLERTLGVPLDQTIKSPSDSASANP